MSTFTAKTPEQARLLLDFTFLRPLGVLMYREASVAEVAQTTDLSVKQAHHKITRLLNAELIWVVGERPRAGRPIKLYRAAPEYRVPFHLSDAETMTEWLSDLQSPFVQAHLQRAGEALRDSDQREATLKLNGKELTIGLSDPDHVREGVSVFTQVRLSAEDQTELKKKLLDIRDWMKGRHTDEEVTGAQDCLLGLFLTTGKMDGL